MYKLKDLTRFAVLRRQAVIWRLRYFTLRNGLHTLEETDLSNPVTVKHNLKSISGCDDRMLDILMPLFSCECFNPSGTTLIVGPRNEHDLFLYASLGGSWKNVRGIDLISYSPKIDLADMHSLPYASNTFDTLICGWTLSYSQEPQKAVDEFLRILRPGSMIALGVEYSNMTPKERRLLQISLDGESYDLGYDETGKRMLNSTQDLIDLLPHGSDIYFKHDAPLKNSHRPEGLIPKPSRVIVVARIP